jgi:hypothetical protein
MPEFVDDFGNKIVDVHEQWQCMGRYCTVHKPSDHGMRSMKQRWRADRALMERVCEHGIGHPDPDEIGLDESGRGVHGCDGCCRTQVLELDGLSAESELAVKVVMAEGSLRERERIAAWVEEHRTYIGDTDSGLIYRDHFNSDDLIKFIYSGELDD